MTDLLIFDLNDNLLTILSNESLDACPFWNAPFKEELNKGSSFSFTIPADHEDSQYVKAENQVAFKDKDGDYRLFVIRELDEEDGDNGPEITAICEPAVLELNDEIITDIRPTNVTAQYALTEILQNSRWQVGTVDNFGTNSATFYYESVSEAIAKEVNTWGGEYKDRIEVSGGTITGRYIDQIARRGADIGKVWEMGKDILKLSRKTQSYPKTALYGRGKGEETADGYGRRTTFADIVWSVANGDPADKPAGQEWIGDPNALQSYGRPNSNGSLRHRFGIYEDQEESDPATLLQKTWDALQDQAKQVVNFEMDVVLLGDLIGYEHEKVRLGDTTYAINRNFAQPIKVQERVIALEYDVSDPDDSGKVELGDFVDLYTDEERLSQIEATLSQKWGEWTDKYKPGDPVQTSWLDGIINVLNNQVQSSNGYVYITDTDGLIVYDKPADQSPTKAIRIKGGIIAIANSKNADGTWNFRTFGTGDGFVADLINTGLLKASVVQIGVGTTFATNYDPSTKETPSGAQSKADAAKSAAISTAASDATTKANNAETNAKNAVANGQVALPSEQLGGTIWITNGTNVIQVDSNFYWDYTGFYAKDPTNPNKIVKITSGGIGISSDGGQTYTTIITGDNVISKMLGATDGGSNGIQITGSALQSVTSSGTRTLVDIDDTLPVLLDGNATSPTQIKAYGKLYTHTFQVYIPAGTYNPSDYISQAVSITDFASVAIPASGAKILFSTLSKEMYVYEQDGSRTNNSGDLTGLTVRLSPHYSWTSGGVYASVTMIIIGYR